MSSLKRPLFYRNVRAREQFDIFLLAAIGSLLTIRFFLHLTGYPALGGGGLHIAHMLWGGLLMALSIIMSLAFLGLRSQRLGALLGGIGFGFFIDEVGKFITSDNDYFYQPAVGIIYAIFVILYLLFNFLARDDKFTSREYQMNALAQLEEAIVHDMDPLEKQRAHDLLQKASHSSLLTKQLLELIESVRLVPEIPPGRFKSWLRKLDTLYRELWQKRTTRGLVRTFFILETGLFVLAVGYGIYNNLDDIMALGDGTPAYGTWLLVGQFVSSLVAASFAIAGAGLLTRSRFLAFEQFRRATLINLFLTEFFIFSRIEFEALPGFLFNVAILLFISYVMHQERRNQPRHRVTI